MSLGTAPLSNWITLTVWLYVGSSLVLLFAVRQLRLYPLYLLKSLWIGFTLVAFAWVVMMSGADAGEFGRHPGGFLEQLGDYPKAFGALFHLDIWWLLPALWLPLWMIRGLATSRNRRRLTAVLLGLAALMLAPLLHLGWTFDWSAYTHFSTNYRHAWRVARMGDYALNSILVSFCAVGLVTIVGSLAAYGLAKLRFRGRSVLTLLLLSGLAIPGVLLMVPLFVMLKDWTVFGFSFSNSRVGLAVIYAALSLPFTTFLLSAFYRNLPTALAKAAVIDGAGPWHVFSEVYFPLSAPALATASIFNFLGIWNEYHFALVFLTNPDYRTLPVGLYNLQVSQQFATNWPAMFAGIVILCLPTFLIFILLQERIVAGLAIGGVKG